MAACCRPDRARSRIASERCGYPRVFMNRSSSVSKSSSIVIVTRCIFCPRNHSLLSLGTFPRGYRARRRRSPSYAQLLTTSYWFGKLSQITRGMPFGRKEVMALAGNRLWRRWVCRFASLIPQEAESVVEVRLPGGFCVVASTVACFDVLSDFVALRRRLGADGAAWQRRSGGGSTGISSFRGRRNADFRRPRRRRRRNRAIRGCRPSRSPLPSLSRSRSRQNRRSR